MVGQFREQVQQQVRENPSRSFPDEARTISRESLENLSRGPHSRPSERLTPPPELSNRNQWASNRSEAPDSDLRKTARGEFSNTAELPTLPSLDKIAAFEDQILRDYTTKVIRNGREVMVPKPGFDEAYQRVIALRESLAPDLQREKRAWLNRLADTVETQSPEVAHLLRDPTRGGSLDETQAQQLLDHLFMILYARERGINTKNLSTMIGEDDHELEERVEWALTWQDKLLVG